MYFHSIMIKQMGTGKDLYISNNTLLLYDGEKMKVKVQKVGRAGTQFTQQRYNTNPGFVYHL